MDVVEFRAKDGDCHILQHVRRDKDRHRDWAWNNDLVLIVDPTQPVLSQGLHDVQPSIFPTQPKPCLIRPEWINYRRRRDSVWLEEVSPVPGSHAVAR